MKLLIMFLISCGLAFGQAPQGCTLSADGKSFTCPVPVTTVPSKPIPVDTNVAAPVLPNQWMGAGAAWNQNTTPQIAGWASYAKLVSAKGQTYSFTSWDITSSKAKPYTAQTSARTGLATVIRQFGPITLLGFGDAGMATSVSNFAGAFSGGGIVAIKLGKTDFTINLAARVIKVASQSNQVIYEFGFGRTSKNN